MQQKRRLLGKLTGAEILNVLSLFRLVWTVICASFVLLRSIFHLVVHCGTRSRIDRNYHVPSPLSAISDGYSDIFFGTPIDKVCRSSSWEHALFQLAIVEYCSLFGDVNRPQWCPISWISWYNTLESYSCFLILDSCRRLLKMAQLQRLEQAKIDMLYR